MYNRRVEERLFNYVSTAVSVRFPGGTEENCENTEAGRPLTRSTFKPNTSQVQVQNVKKIFRK